MHFWWTNNKLINCHRADEKIELIVENIYKWFDCRASQYALMQFILSYSLIKISLFSLNSVSQWSNVLIKGKGFHIKLDGKADWYLILMYCVNFIRTYPRCQQHVRANWQKNDVLPIFPCVASLLLQEINEYRLHLTGFFLH